MATVLPPELLWRIALESQSAFSALLAVPSVARYAHKPHVQVMVRKHFGQSYAFMDEYRALAHHYDLPCIHSLDKCVSCSTTSDIIPQCIIWICRPRAKDRLRRNLPYYIPSYLHVDLCTRCAQYISSNYILRGGWDRWDAIDGLCQDIRNGFFVPKN